MWKFAIYFLVVLTRDVQNCDPTQWNTISKTLGLDEIEDSLMYVINSGDIRQLCKGSIKTLPSLQLIALNRGNISYIEPGTFNSVSEVSVELEGNKLKEVINGVFNGTQISSVNLESNEITAIESCAFDDMPNLQTVILDNNKIAFWNNEWFKNTPKLTTILFATNSIEYLPADAFKNVCQNKNPTLIFEGNKIKSLHERCFNCLESVAKINLARNELQIIPLQVFNIVLKIRILDLKQNKIDCLSVNLKNVDIIKLQGNPFTEICKTKIVEYSKENGVKLYLSDDPFSY